MNKQTSKKKPHGKIRRSQVITTFGPGAMLDLPHYSVLVGGLDGWSDAGTEEIHEPRLVEKLKVILDVQHLRLRTPPVDLDDPAVTTTGINVWQFPEWFVTEVVKVPNQPPNVRSRMLVHRRQLQGKSVFDYKDGPKSKKLPVVPVRFVRACRNGHIGDILWNYFVHGNSACNRQMWIDETGTSADLSELLVRCECGVQRRMSDAAAKDRHALGMCDGGQPWLSPALKAPGCREHNRLLIRTASNSYFAQLLSVISLPENDEELVRRVGHVWHFLQPVKDAQALAMVKSFYTDVASSLEGFADENVLAEIERRRSGSGPSVKSVKQVEIETLSTVKNDGDHDKPNGDFFARSSPPEKWKDLLKRPWMQNICNVVLVHRLREVAALAGFTRFEAASPDVTGELDIEVQRAPLAREVTWVPAIENKGEGIFLQFQDEAIDAWYAKDTVKHREQSLRAGFETWRQEHPGSERELPDARYIMLHSFSHLLITAISIECGYSASSIRERVYALPGVGYGVLLFTGSPDAEGTLGGLVEVGRRIHLHVKSALEMARLCSNDPVCAEHDPKDEHERRFLQGAACHGCLLIAETSCEQHNDFLDRSLVVSTVENNGTEFFQLDGI